MGTEEALLAAVLAEPGDDAPRLILADWWEGQDEWEGGDQRERAEFVRVQVELAAMPESCRDGSDAFPMVADICTTCARADALRRREGELHWSPYLWAPAGPRWHDAPKWGFGWRRGFVRSAACTFARWLEHGDVLTGRHPVEEVTLTTWPRLFSTVDNPRREVRYWFRPEEADDDEKVFRVSMRLRAAESPPEQVILLGALRARWPRVRHWHLPSRRIEPSRTHGAPWQDTTFTGHRTRVPRIP